MIAVTLVEDDGPDMAAGPREAVLALAATLAPGIADISFPEVVRRLMRAGGGHGRHIAGQAGTLHKEAVLFRASPSLGFPPGDMSALRPRDAKTDWPVELEVAFLGLYGPSSPLPSPWTERILAGDADARDNLRDLLDLFGHRLVALLHRVWQHHRLHLRFDGKGQDLASRALLQVAGAGAQPGGEGQLDPLRLLPLAGLLAQHARSASVLQRIIGGYFEVPVVIEEWVVRSVPIPKQALFCLGSPAAALGAGALLGSDVLDVGTTVCFVLGPLTAAVFDSLLPGGTRRAELKALLRLAVREPVLCQIDLLMGASEPGALTLGAGQLGWTSWSGDATTQRCATGIA